MGEHVIMITIGRTYLVFDGRMSRLCADISVDEGTASTMWFSMGHGMENWLCEGRADAFVMALMLAAIKGGHDIICEYPISIRFYYQMNQQLIPAMGFAFDKKAEHFLCVKAPLSNSVFQKGETVAASFSDRKSFLRTMCSHRQGSLYPLTHIAVWNTEGDGGRKDFHSRCREAALAETWGLQTIFLDANFDQILNEELAASCIFRELACALSIEQGLSLFLLPTAHPAAFFKVDLQDSESYALLIANFAITENFSVYLDGVEAEAVRTTTQDSEEIFTIGVPYIEEDMDGKTRLCACVTFKGQKQVMWFSVNSEYGRYLTQDRADAFVAALLTPAMRAGADIVSYAPVSKSLLYQLNQYLIPMMALNMSSVFHLVILHAKLIQTVPDCDGAVCTSGTAGVDCLFSLYQDQVLPADSDQKLTHLFLTSNELLSEAFCLIHYN